MILAQGKTNWKYLAILVVLAVIVGGGILFWIRTQEIPPVEFPEIKRPEKIVKEEKGIEEKCENIQDLDEQTECYTELAKETKDESYCEKIGKIEIPETLEVGDTGPILASRGECYIGLAILKNDPSICWKVGTASLASSCWEYFGMQEWKIYSNEEYRFVMKYPENWEFSETLYPKEMELYVFSVGFVLKGEVYWVEGTPGIYPIKIFVNKSFPEYINNKEKEEQILVNVKPAIKREGYLGLEYEIAFLQPNSLGYYLEFVNSIQNVKAAGNISENEATQFNKIFNQMLSTFRFWE